MPYVLLLLILGFGSLVIVARVIVQYALIPARELFARLSGSARL